MILAIRISGLVKIDKDIEETLYRIRLRRKYSAVLLQDNPENRKLLRKVRNFVAYGDISEEMTKKLIELRGKGKNRAKIDSKKIAEELGKKSLEKLGLKPFFRLHPPRGGIESKKHFGVGRGVLGDNKDKINSLLEKML